MLNVFIIISKYLFILYISLFLLNGFIAATHKDIKSRYNAAIFVQRLCILLFHLNAYIIFIAADPLLFTQISGRCIETAVFLIAAFVLSAKLYPAGSHLLWNGVLFLSDIGMVTLASLNPGLAEKQLIWHLIGFILALALPAILDRLPRLDLFKSFYIITAIVLLVSTLIFGREEFGSKNWISIGSLSFQPSEVVKIFFIAYLASALNQKPTIDQLIKPGILCVVILLCFVLQKDLGSALIFFMSFMVVLYIATSNIGYFLLGIGAASVGAYLAYLIFPHIQVRVSAWLDPWSDVANSGYQIAHSLFAIATYGLVGAGLTKGYSTSIPVVERDFIFSAICEEFGVIFGIAVVLIFLMIFLEGAVGALNAKNRFLCLFCAGLTALMAFQTFVILGGVTKLIPLTGVTLPFVSYGGTSVLVCYLLIGIIQWVYKSCVQYAQRPEPKKNERRQHSEDIDLDEVLEFNKRRKRQ